MTKGREWAGFPSPHFFIRGTAMRRFFSLSAHWFQAERPAIGRRRVCLALDTLEERAVPAIVGPEWRSIDGSGNNLANPSWGQVGTDYIRVAPAA